MRAIARPSRALRILVNKTGFLRLSLQEAAYHDKRGEFGNRPENQLIERLKTLSQGSI